jgi:hypothetical protein
MSEFFKAAAQCDLTVLDQAPMYVDPKVIYAEKMRHEELVQQTLKTKQLLAVLDREDEEQEAAKTNSSKVAASADSSALSPSYHVPPAVDLNTDPKDRTLGSVAQHKKLSEKLNIFRQNLESAHEVVKGKEKEEQTSAKQRADYEQRMGERELNALIVAKQLAAREAEAQKLREREMAERANRKAHPIDVLHHQIALELTTEAVNDTLQLQQEVWRQNSGLDHYLQTMERDRLHKQYKHYSPSKHIPTGF